MTPKLVPELIGEISPFNSSTRKQAKEKRKLAKSSGYNNRARSIMVLKVVIVKSVLKLASVWLIFASSLLHGQSKFVIETDEFRYTATFYPSRISEGRLRELLFLSPYDLGGSETQLDHKEVIMGFQETPGKLRKGPISYSLEVCIDSDPRYRPCGTRDISDANFFANARTNLDKNKELLAALNQQDVPRELKGILQQFIDSMTFYSTIERLRLEYFQTGDLGVLSRPIANLDPLRICSKEIGELREATTVQRRYELATYEWHKCLNLEWDRVSPPYPQKAWAGFLHTFGISERYTYKPVN